LTRAKCSGCGDEGRNLRSRLDRKPRDTRTIGSQLATLRTRVAAAQDDLVAAFCDDGYCGARLDRPGLDALRDAAEAQLIDAVWCLSPDRLARMSAYPVIVLDELERHGVRVLFCHAPTLDDDPQARLLTQVQGVIAEYERAKIAERYRRGKLYIVGDDQFHAVKPARLKVRAKGHSRSNGFRDGRAWSRFLLIVLMEDAEKLRPAA
jgi:DNA invertase Pin-like site-specific DNA recombinase